MQLAILKNFQLFQLIPTLILGSAFIALGVREEAQSYVCGFETANHA